MSISSFPTQLILLIYFAAYVQAKWYYDQASCGSHTKLLVNNGMPSALSMLKDAAVAIGSPAPRPNSNGDVWSFPHPEIRDLAGMIFGTTGREAERYSTIRNGFTYVDENYQTPGGPIGWHSPTTKNPDDGSIELQSFGQVSVDSITDVVFYCDLKRYVLTRNENHEYWQNQHDPTDRLGKKVYRQCNRAASPQPQVFGPAVTYAFTVNPWTGRPYNSDTYPSVSIQLCPPFIAKFEQQEYVNVEKVVKTWFYKLLGPINLREWVFETGAPPIDVIALFDLVLVHEANPPSISKLTHAIRDSAWYSGQPKSTDDAWGKFSYGWNNVYQMRLKPSDAANNAESWAYFALGVQQLQKGNRIKADGSMEAIEPIDLTKNNHILVSASWNPHRMIKTRSNHPEAGLVNGEEHTQNGYFRNHNMSSLSDQLISSSGTGKIASAAFPTTANSTGLYLPKFFNRTSSLDYRTFSSTSSTNNRSETSPKSSSAKSTMTTSHSQPSTSGRSSTPRLAVDPTQSTTSRKSPSASSKTQQSTTSSKGPSTSSKTQQSSILSSTSTDPGAWIWYMKTTPVPTATQIIPAFVSGVTPSSLTQSIASITIDLGFFIPLITNTADFPVVNVKNPDPQDDDDSDPVPFVKVKIPEDKCGSLPNVNNGGLLGFGFNLAGSIVNGVRDAACNLIFPILKGKPPKWLSLSIYPPAANFPPLPGSVSGDPPKDDPPKSDPQPSENTKTTSKSSESSSCSATIAPHCTDFCFPTTVSGRSTITSTCTQTCKTVSACSATGTTTTTTSSVSASTGIPIKIVDVAPNITWYDVQASLLVELQRDIPTTFPASLFAKFTSSHVPASATIAPKTKNPLSSSSNYIPLPCYHYADPHHGIKICTCDNGASTAIAQSTGSNTGSDYNPCPYTVAPALQSTSLFSSTLPSRSSSTLSSSKLSTTHPPSPTTTSSTRHAPTCASGSDCREYCACNVSQDNCAPICLGVNGVKKCICGS